MQKGGYLSSNISTVKPAANQGLRNEITQVQEWNILKYHEYQLLCAQSDISGRSDIVAAQYNSIQHGTTIRMLNESHCDSEYLIVFIISKA